MENPSVTQAFSIGLLPGADAGQQLFRLILPIPGIGAITGTWAAIRNHLDGACFDFVYDAFERERVNGTPLARTMRGYFIGRAIDACEEARRA